ncbi:MAG TPA: AraC family transcriptional regulator [Noviherbaspirillum sp.]
MLPRKAMPSVRNTMIRPNANGSVSSAYLRTLLDVAERSGAHVSQLLREAGLPADVRHSPELRLPASQAMRLFECAVSATGDTDLGLHMGEAVRPASFNALGYAAMSCATLAESLPLILRFERLVTELGTTELRQDGDWMTIAWRPIVESNAGMRAIQDAIVSGWLTFARWMTGIDGELREARFAHPAPARREEYVRIFRCPLRFSAGENALVFHRHFLAQPLLAADKAFHMHQHARAQALLRQLDSHPGFAQRVAALIRQHLPYGAPSAQRLARVLHVSERTFRRRLEAEGAGYQALLDSIRYQQALLYLDDPHLTILDIALLLGYAEASALTHAFKSWTGTSPQQYRHGKQKARPPQSLDSTRIPRPAQP